MRATCRGPWPARPSGAAELRESLDKRAKGKPMLFRIQRQNAKLFLTLTVQQIR